jgi:hypothetical protein
LDLRANRLVILSLKHLNHIYLLTVCLNWAYTDYGTDNLLRLSDALKMM